MSITGTRKEIDVITLSDSDENSETLPPQPTGPGHKKQPKKTEQFAVNITLPSDEWYEMMYGPLDESASGFSRVLPRKPVNRSTTKRSAETVPADIPAKKKLRSNSSTDITPSTSESATHQKQPSEGAVDLGRVLVEPVSDGEDLLTALPIRHAIGNGSGIDNDQGAVHQQVDELSSPVGTVADAEKEIDWYEVYAIGSSTSADVAAALEISTYRCTYNSEFNRFNKSIWSHFTKNLQNDHTYAWKMRIRSILMSELQKLYLNFELIAVGSTVNGCGAYNSDMDLCLCVPCPTQPRPYDTPRRFAVKQLKHAKKLLASKLPNLVQNVEYIDAKVPILKVDFLPPYDQLQVDLNCNNVAGIHNSFLVHHYSRIDDKFPALCLLVKHWAKSEGIGDAFEGYLNSYSLILMVLHYLQCGVCPPLLPNLQALYPQHFSAERPLDSINLFGELPHPLPDIPLNPASIGELLIGFFDYYNKFDFDLYAISIRRATVFPREELAENTTRYRLFVEEPYDEQNTARCVTSDEHWIKIVDAFRRAREAFSDELPPDLLSIGIQWDTPC